MSKEFKPLLQRMREKSAAAKDQKEIVRRPFIQVNRPADGGTAGKARLSDYTVTPRSTPKGTTLVKQSDDEVIMTVRYVLQFWWPWLPVALLAFTIVGAAPLGSFIGVAISDWDSNRVPGTVMVFVLGSLIATIIAYRNTRGEVPIVAQADKIKVGDKVFDRRHYGGMRMGYTVESDDGALKNDFLDQQMGYAALRLSYGRWGEDLPYLVNKYHAPEIVIWMNELIDSMGAAPAKDVDAAKGLRGQIF